MINVSIRAVDFVELVCTQMRAVRQLSVSDIQLLNRSWESMIKVLKCATSLSSMNSHLNLYHHSMNGLKSIFRWEDSNGKYDTQFADDITNYVVNGRSDLSTWHSYLPVDKAAGWSLYYLRDVLRTCDAPRTWIQFWKQRFEKFPKS